MTESFGVPWEPSSPPSGCYLAPTAPTPTALLPIPLHSLTGEWMCCDTEGGPTAEVVVSVGFVHFFQSDEPHITNEEVEAHRLKEPAALGYLTSL